MNKENRKGCDTCRYNDVVMHALTASRREVIFCKVKHKAIKVRKQCKDHTLERSMN